MYLALSLGYNLKVPKWNAPDEPAHYNYVRELAEGRRLPVLGPEDWDLEYLERLKTAKFPDNLPIDSIRYESHQPPLYYIVSLPVYAIAAGWPVTSQVFAMRLLSTFFGALLLVVAYSTVREVFPRDRWMPLMAASFVALVPMYTAINASITNDSLANLMLSSIILILVTLASPTRQAMWSKDNSSEWSPTCGQSEESHLRKWLIARWWRGPLLLGFLLGLALLTKTTAYTAVALVAVGMSWAGQPWRRGWRYFIASLGIVYAVALVFDGWWFARNALTYGNLDITGLRYHDIVVVGQPKTGAFDWAAISHLTTVTFNSFWAQFGWMGVPADERTFRFIGALCGMVGLGLLIFCFRALKDWRILSPFQWGALGLLLLSLMLTVAGFVWYNLTYIQAQGRYLFPAMVAIGTFFSLGLSQLAPRPLTPLLYGLVTAALLVLNLYCLFRVVAPAFGT